MTKVLGDYFGAYARLAVGLGPGHLVRVEGLSEILRFANVGECTAHDGRVVHDAWGFHGG